LYEVDAVDITHTPPLPEWSRMKRAILQHTWFRQFGFIRSSAVDPNLHDLHFLRLREINRCIDNLLRYDNGDIRSDKLVHHEVGCCPGGLEARSVNPPIKFYLLPTRLQFEQHLICVSLSAVCMQAEGSSPNL
jgi:hypothetical protein